MLLARDRELDALTTLLDDARVGSSGVLALVGEPGIGKSSLLDWTAEHADGMNVLRARGVQSEAHIPFAGLFELLRPALDSLDRLPAPQAAALESALALRPAQAHDRFAVGAATLTLLAAFAETKPLAVLVDDAHWLDGSTGGTLRFALRRLLADPIAVVLTARENEPSFLDGADFATLHLAGLDADAAAELVRRAAPGTTGGAAARLHRDTGGNPLALLELADQHVPDIPLATPTAAVTSVASAYLERAHQLPEQTRSALVVAAASDRGDVSVLERALGKLGLAVADLIPSESAGLLSIGAGHVEFRHPLTRSAIYGDASPEERRAAHRALADALPDTEADRRAWHLALAAAGPDDRASAALEQAGARARDRSAYDVASHAFERAASLAADEHRRASLAFVGAEAAWLAGRPGRALALLDRLQPSDDALRIDADHLRGEIALRRGPIHTARTILLEAAERAEKQAPARAVVLYAQAGEAAFFAGDADDLRACGEKAAAIAETVASEQTAFFGRITAGMGRVLAGEEAGAQLIREAVSLLEHSDELEHNQRLLGWAAMGPLWLRETGTGDALVERALANARAHSGAGELPHLLWHVGIGDAAADRFVAAQATFDETIALCRETGQRILLAGALARLALIDARCGREAIARQHAEEALSLAHELGAYLFEIWALTSLGELELVRGDAAAASARYDELQLILERQHISDPDLSPAPERIELSLRVGRADDATPIAAAFAEAAAAKGQPWALARAERAQALLSTDDTFEHHFEHALELHACTPDGFETARTRLAYGARLRRARHRVRAREQLRQAHSAFDELGAEPWAEQARSELAATGETARRRNPSTLDELTPQELKIALLLAAGKTTRETAAALFLSPKTIEYHLRNVYRKLDVRSRDELATAVATRKGVSSTPEPSSTPAQSPPERSE
jgi:DNA-binding CsgD family transcriptional regulator